jgi:2-dehydro-3-deoxygluconokinase
MMNSQPPLAIRYDVVTLGEMMALLVADAPGPLETVATFHKRTAGAETNVAIGLARLGLRVAWVSRLGADSWGRYLLHEMQREGIDVSQVVIDADARTGIVLKARAVDGSDPVIEYHRKGSAASRLAGSDVDRGFLLSARHLHATGVFPGVSASCLGATHHAIDVMKRAGRTISFDPNLRPALWVSQEAMVHTLNSLAVNCDWVLPGLEEGQLLTGSKDPKQIAAFYLEQGVKFVAVKLGADGAYYDDGRESGVVPAFPVEQIIDTVGAGDGFAVGVVSALLEGKPIADAVRRGTWIGARAIQVLGDTEGLPARAQLDAAGL